MTEHEAAFLADVGLRIRVLRTARKLSQDRLAEVSEVSRVTLGSIERGNHEAGILSFRALAVALDVPLTLLFEDSTDMDLLMRTFTRRQ
jgi:transcriptional regulator with XRE-family HTH domain